MIACKTNSVTVQFDSRSRPRSLIPSSSLLRRLSLCARPCRLLAVVDAQGLHAAVEARAGQSQQFGGLALDVPRLRESQLDLLLFDPLQKRFQGRCARGARGADRLGVQPRPKTKRKILRAEVRFRARRPG